jgi:hypothetical protein
MNDSQPYRRFRIASLEGPFHHGALNQFHDYHIDVELDPGGVYHAKVERVGLRLFDTAYWALGAEDPAVIPFEDQAKARVAHYITEVLLEQLPTSAAIFPLRLQPTVSDVQHLKAVDPRKVDISAWKDIQPRPPSARRRVFISCGQSNPDEIALGQRIATAVTERTGLEGYFAQNQQSLDGLTREVLNCIHNAAGFIAVMHRRDQLPGNPPAFRGSVWVEQEIAIAAFIVQSLGLRLPSRAYVQRGIRREGVRGFILLNPTEFETSSEVIEDLNTFWTELVPHRP